MDWLNRLGIILNCLAGFMMAPDIIGRPRLNRWEVSLEKRVKEVQQILASLYVKLGIRRLVSGDIGVAFIITTGFAILVTTFSTIFWWRVAPSLVGVGFDGSSVLLDVGFIAFSPLMMGMLFVGGLALSNSEKFNAFVIILLVIFVVSLISVWGVLIGSLLLFGYTLPQILEALLSSTIKKMEGTDRFASVFIKAGIIFFIVGNLLQLLATFKLSK